MKQSATRRRVLLGVGAALSAAANLKFPAGAAEFTYKFGNAQTLDYPNNTRGLEMAVNVKRESNGRLEIQIFPNSSLGSDESMMTQVRTGALQFSTQGGAILSTVAPLAAIESVPFAFKNSKDAFAAQDGALGAAVRKELELRAGFHVFPYELDVGFLEITNSVRPIRTVDDIAGMKIRTPVGNLYIETMKLLGASVTTMSIGEVYTALQTHLIDGVVTPLLIIETQRIYELQKYLSLTNHSWGGQWFYCNGDAWRALPSDLQGVLDRNARLYAMNQRRDLATAAAMLRAKLTSQGLIINDVQREGFVTRLTPYYTKAKNDFGPANWAILERYAGKLG